MPTRVECGHCRKAFAAPDHLAGKTVACPSCRAPIAIAGRDTPTLADLLDDVIPVAAPHEEKHEVQQQPVSHTLTPSPRRPASKSDAGGKKLLSVLGGVVACVLSFGGVIAYIGNSLGLLDDPVQRYQKISDEGIAVFESLLDEHMKISTAEDARAAAPRITQKWNDFLRVAEEDVQFRKKKYRLRDIEKMKQINRDTERRLRSTAERLGLRMGVLCLQGEVGRIVAQAIPDDVAKWSPDISRLKSELLKAAVSQPSSNPIAAVTPSPPTAPPIPSESSTSVADPQTKAPVVIDRPPATPIASPNKFERQAQTAIDQKRSGSAVDFIRAQIITKDDSAVIDELRWCPGLKRPLINLYWGVGIEPVGFPASNQSPHESTDWRNIPFDLRTFARPPRHRLTSQRFVHREMERILGPMQDSLLDGLQGRINDGRFGNWRTVDTNVDKGGGMVGISLLSVHPLEQLIRIARNQGMDVLLVARVEQKSKARIRNSTTATLRLILIDVFQEKSFWESGLLSSRQLATGGAGTQKGAEFVEVFFAKVDELLKLRDLPTIKSTAIPKRVAKIAESPPEAALCALAEIRYYVCKGLLDSKEAIPHYQKLLGQLPATDFANGSVDDRQKAVEHLLDGG